MAVRLHMNLGVVAEEQRFPDSADTVVVVEPTIGSTTRTKGSLYLLVTGDGGRKLREATKLVAERIRDDYYYDLSAGISVCLRKAVRAANKMLLHSPDRPVVGPGEPSPIGLALAVVRGNELYVATIGPAEAYLVRQARLLTLPDADPESGLPAEDVDGPEVWHGEIAAGDCLILISPNVTRRIGLGPIQDAVLQLHPQAAVDQIHRQFGSGSLGSTGGDGILFIEATEVASTHKAAPLKPVWPADSLAGAPDRSPIPLADTVVGGVATLQTTARHAQIAADGWLRRGVYGLFDRMPQRPMSRGRVTPMTVRRERQQRAAIAIVGLLAVIAIVGTSMWFLSGADQSQKIDTQTKAQQAYTQVQADIKAVYGNGPRPPDERPRHRRRLSHRRLQAARDRRAERLPAVAACGAASTGCVRPQPATTTSPSCSRSVVALLRHRRARARGPGSGRGRLRHRQHGQHRLLGQPPDRGQAAGLQGRPGAAHRGRHRGQPAPADHRRPGRTDPGRLQLAVAVAAGRRQHHRSGRSDQGHHPRQRDLGPGSPRDRAPSSSTRRSASTTSTSSSRAAQQILKYPPATDGSGFPAVGRANYLSVAQDVSTVDDMYVDGKIYLVDKGKITQYELGQAVHGWTGSPDPPGDKLLRPNGPVYTRLTADNPAQDQGTFYAYDGINRRIVAFKKIDGSIVGQYMVPPDAPWFTSLAGMFVTTGAGGSNPTLYWIESGNLMSAALSSTGTSTPGASAGLLPPSGASGAAGSGSGAAATKTP